MGEWKLLVLGFSIFAMVEDSGGKVVNTTQWKGCCPPVRHCPSLEPPWNDAARYKKICQYYKNRSHYATLFDTIERIPVFSFFNITANRSKGRRTSFDNEPQLVHPALSQNMTSESELKKANIDHLPITKAQIKVRQAVKEDYPERSGYHRGHLNPAAGHRNWETVNSTNTYTNVVPQVGTFNQGCWKSLEMRTRKYVMATCEQHHTVVVGAVPHLGSSDRVNKPSYMWSYVICNGIVTAFYVRNKDNNDIKQDSSLIMFEYRDDPKSVVQNFTNHMRYLARRGVTENHENPEELTMKWQESSTNPLILGSACTFNTHLPRYHCKCTTNKRIRQESSSEDSSEDWSMASKEDSSMHSEEDSSEDWSMHSKEDSSMHSEEDSSEDWSMASKEDSSMHSKEDSSEDWSMASKEDSSMHSEEDS